MSGGDPASTPDDGDGPDTDGSPDTDDAEAARLRPKKSPNAFRTISEVADDLHIPQHVLRFWETKFPQVKPLKRGGGRRYYRPDDIALLRRISGLLYVQGYTIKGVQRLLREGGGKLSDDIPPPGLDDLAEPDVDSTPEPAPGPQMSMPGLAADTPPRPAGRGPDAPPPASPAPSAAGPAPASAEDTELHRLKTLLAATLEELVALRALLP